MHVCTERYILAHRCVQGSYISIWKRKNSLATYISTTNRCISEDPLDMQTLDNSGCSSNHSGG